MTESNARSKSELLSEDSASRAASRKRAYSSESVSPRLRCGFFAGLRMQRLIARITRGLGRKSTYPPCPNSPSQLYVRSPRSVVIPRITGTGGPESFRLPFQQHQDKADFAVSGAGFSPAHKSFDM